MDFIDALLDLCKSDKQPIVAIDGPAGAGKTILASTLSMALASHCSVTQIHMDDLYDGWDNALSEHLTSVLSYIRDTHKKAEEISLSTYDWNSGRFNPPTSQKKSELLILEGVGCGQRAIRTSLAALIWIDIDEVHGLERVLQRDGIAIENEMKKWLTTQEQHFAAEGTQKAADFVLST